MTITLRSRKEIQGPKDPIGIEKGKDVDEKQELKENI